MRKTIAPYLKIKGYSIKNNFVLSTSDGKKLVSFMLYLYMNNIQNSKMSKKPIYHTDGYI